MQQYSSATHFRCRDCAVYFIVYFRKEKSRESRGIVEPPLSGNDYDDYDDDVGLVRKAALAGFKFKGNWTAKTIQVFGARLATDRTYTIIKSRRGQRDFLRTN